MFLKAPKIPKSMSELVCQATKQRITNESGSVRFKCPQCGKYEIIRSLRARQIAAKYTCPECGFEGPN